MTWRWKMAQWLELRWWRNYQRGKTAADYLAWKRNYWNTLLQGAGLQVPERATVIDFGCGPAGVFIALPQASVTAVDPLLNQYKQHIHFFNTTAYPNVRFINLPMEAYKAERSYDWAFCMNAINHVADIQKAFQILCQSVRPGGKIVVSIDAHNHRFFKHLFRLIPGDALHPHQYDLEEYKSFLSAGGCTDIQVYPVKKEFFFSHMVLIANASL